MNRKDKINLDSVLIDMVFDLDNLQKNRLGDGRIEILLQTRIEDLRKIIKGDFKRWLKAFHILITYGLNSIIKRLA